MNYPNPDTPRTKDGKPYLSAPAPRASDGKPDLSGVWRGEPTPHGEVTRVLGEHFYDLQTDVEDNSKYTFNLLWDLKPVEELLRPEAAALVKERLARSSPGQNCLPGSIPFAMLITPFKIVQAPREIVMLFEHPDPPRQIHTDGRRFPKIPNLPGKGHPVGGGKARR